MNIALFTYNFPHKRTQDFMMRMHLYGFLPRVVIASPPEELGLPAVTLEDKYRHIDLIHPKELCERMNVSYREIPHRDRKVSDILKANNTDIGIIAGARVLKKHVIEAVRLGIINFHPGLIPENRGLGAVKWAVVLNIPQGATAHFINEKIDHGRIIKKYMVPVYSKDGFKDINIRIFESHLEMLIATLKLIQAGLPETYAVEENAACHRPPDEKLDWKAIRAFEAYKNKWAHDKNNGWLCTCGSKLDTKNQNEVALCGVCGGKFRLLKNRNREFLQMI